jgi:hypothetical protein
MKTLSRRDLLVLAAAASKVAPHLLRAQSGVAAFSLSEGQFQVSLEDHSISATLTDRRSYRFKAQDDKYRAFTHFPESFDSTACQKVRSAMATIVEDPLLTPEEGALVRALIQNLDKFAGTQPAPALRTLHNLQEVLEAARRPPVGDDYLLYRVESAKPLVFVRASSERAFLDLVGEDLLWFDLKSDSSGKTVSDPLTSIRRTLQGIQAQRGKQLSADIERWPIGGARYSLEQIVRVRNAYEEARAAGNPFDRSPAYFQLFQDLERNGLIRRESSSGKLYFGGVIPGSSLIACGYRADLSDDALEEMLGHEVAHVAAADAPEMVNGFAALLGTLEKSERDSVLRALSMVYEIDISTPGPKRDLALKEFGAYGRNATSSLIFKGVSAATRQRIESEIRRLERTYAPLLRSKESLPRSRDFGESVWEDQIL